MQQQLEEITTLFSSLVYEYYGKNREDSSHEAARRVLADAAIVSAEFVDDKVIFYALNPSSLIGASKDNDYWWNSIQDVIKEKTGYLICLGLYNDNARMKDTTLVYEFTKSTNNHY